ncbi:MAG: hypothetical protein AAFY54_01365 [Cyanobacteria bacterium J06648_10]
MSTSVLPQLLAVDSELSEQAAVLAARLTELQEKQKGIQTVIAMFESGANVDMADLSAVTGTDTKATDTKAKTTAKTTKSTKAAATKKTAKRKTAKSSTAKTTKAKATRGRPAKAATKAATKAPQKAKSTKSATATKEKKATGKRSGRTANWQRYVQEDYRKSALPDVIGGVLQAQPTNVFKIADVMSAVFKEDMPKNHFLKARNRISNILSAGARDGVWYRGRGGTYSMSEKAIKAS